MDMHSREQYLESLREEYRRAGKKQKKRLLNEARKRTHLNRKVLIRKLAHPAKVPTSQKRAAAEGDLVWSEKSNAQLSAADRALWAKF